MTIAQADAWWQHHLGDSEHPPNSNHTVVWDEYHRITSAKPWQGAPYCGAGVTDGNWEGGFHNPVNWISVLEAQNWAEEQGRWSRSPSTAKHGDTVVLFGRGVHMGYVRGDAHNGVVPTYEANTSPGIEGSQYNGGTIAEKVRSYGEVYGVIKCHDRFPGPKGKPKPDNSKSGKKHPTPQFNHESKTGALHIWEVGVRVEDMQEMLGMKNTDGYYGRGTARAVKRYADKHLPKLKTHEGHVAPKTFLDHLRKATGHQRPKRKIPDTLHFGDAGGLVRKLQRELNRQDLRGIPHIKDDGDYGKLTAEAVKKLKQEHPKIWKKSETNGKIAGPEVWKVLL